jgi:holo-[acyl-carrier protein] synthase
MILGVGVDLVSIPRLQRTIGRHGGRALRRLFTPGELHRACGRRRSDASLAARFAAKEAFFKALGTGWGRGGSWTEVEVVSAPNGAPSLRVHGTAAARAAAKGVERIHLSLSHTHENATAYLVLEGGADFR